MRQNLSTLIYDKSMPISIHGQFVYQGHPALGWSQDEKSLRSEARAEFLDRCLDFRFHNYKIG